MRIESDEAAMTIPAPVSGAVFLAASTLTMLRLSVFQSGVAKTGSAKQSMTRDRTIEAKSTPRLNNSDAQFRFAVGR
jgi:hypothetical protein